jgi:hypothetical protein
MLYPIETPDGIRFFGLAQTGIPFLIRTLSDAGLAQLVEQRTLNPLVQGSSPWSGTTFGQLSSVGRAADL